MYQDPIRIEATLNQLKVPVPAAIADLAALVRGLREAAANRPIEGLRAEMAAGAVTAANVGEKLRAAALVYVASKFSGEVVRTLDKSLAQLIRRTFAEADDDIVLVLRPVFDDAAASVAASVEELGPNPDPDVIVAAGRAASDDWQRRQAAEKILRTIRQVLIDVRGSGTDHVSWWVPTLDVDGTLEAPRRVMNNDIARLVAAGFEVRLNLKSEADELAVGARRSAEEAARPARELAEALEAGRDKSARQRVSVRPMPASELD